MRHIAKLSLIFFLALTAQANADTTIICKGETRGAPPTPMVITYNEDANGKITNFRIKDVAGCRQLYKYDITKERIDFYCKVDLDPPSFTIVLIDRYAGQYLHKEQLKGEGNLRLHEGQCEKAKRKF
tara:strand:- start:1299 stop:1679 length:381 start_codon:yes stop_codon:yes gene_type:complete